MCRPAKSPPPTFVHEFGKAAPWRIYCRRRSNLIYFSITYTTKRTSIARTSKATALAIARAMLDKKATDVLILHVAKLTSLADYLVLGSADSDRQIKAIADHVDSVLSQSGSGPFSIEGKASSQWVLIDFGDVVAHVFRQDARQHYGLERLWADAKRVAVPAKISSRPIVTKPLPPKRVRITRRA